MAPAGKEASADMVVTRAYISIGSNLGNRRENCLSAIEMLSHVPSVKVMRKSGLYETDPLGVIDQPKFINCAVEIETPSDPRTLMTFLKEIETDMGRKDGLKWGPRVIDLDIIFYGNVVVREDELEIPHPHAHERAFVLFPLAEIDPELTHPVLKKTVSELLARLEGDGGVRKLP